MNLPRVPMPCAKHIACGAANPLPLMYILYVLWLRQVKRYLRSRARIIGSLGQPILFLFALGFGLGPSFSATHGGQDYMSFIAPGIIAMSILFTAMFSGIEIIWDRQFGFLKETFVAPVSRLTIMTGRTIGGATVALLQGCIVFVIAIIGGFRPETPSLLPLAFIVMFLIALTFTALGTAVACRLEDMQGFQLIMNFLIMPLFFLSGALFPIDQLPHVLSLLVHANPLTYGVDALRSALIDGGHFSLQLSLRILVCAMSLFLAVGSWLFSTMEL